jgi:uncharacterized protein
MPDAPETVPPSPVTPASPPEPPPPSAEAAVTKVFVGPNGIRAGWRLAIWLILFILLAAIINAILHRIPYIAQNFPGPKKGEPEVMTPWGQIFSEGSTVLLLFLSVWIMSLIEKKSFKDYGLPARGAFGTRFWQGIAFGFASISLLMGAIGGLHGFSIEGLALSGADIAKYGFLYGIGFILVGFFEEFSFRGYMQATLGSGIGFWPAAVILAVLFGAAHAGNGGEKIYGLVMAGSYGLFAAFTLSRTGNLWFAIGDHAAWDWGETYFYSTPDSGILAKGHLLNSSFHGPDWLTGGSVGPEGSYLVFGVVVLTFIAVHFLFPAKKIAS